MERLACSFIEKADEELGTRKNFAARFQFFASFFNQRGGRVEVDKAAVFFDSADCMGLVAIRAMMLFKKTFRYPKLSVIRAIMRGEKRLEITIFGGRENVVRRTPFFIVTVREGKTRERLVFASGIAVDNAFEVLTRRFPTLFPNLLLTGLP